MILVKSHAKKVCRSAGFGPSGPKSVRFGSTLDMLFLKSNKHQNLWNSSVIMVLAWLWLSFHEIRQSVVGENHRYRPPTTTLNEALWAYQMACHGATKMSPYQLVYGHEAVLHWELRTGSRHITFQDQLTAEDYTALMKDELEDLAGHWLNALISIEANKARIGRWYDKKVKAKSFDQGDLVWKLVLPLGTKDPKFGK